MKKVKLVSLIGLGLTIVVYNPRLLLAAVNWQTDDLHFDKRIDNLRNDRQKS